jgi:uncharacterized membrane protein HdeD (DUF308 family)
MAYLRRLLAPDQSRWQPMLMGLCLFAAGAGAAVLLQPAGGIAALMIVLAFAAWVVGACAMVGYLRWYITSELQRARQDKASKPD